VRKVDNLPPSCAVVTKSWNLNFLGLSRPVMGLPVLDRTAYGSNNDLMMDSGEAKHVVTLNDNKTTCV